jgi:mycothiol synthase
VRAVAGEHEAANRALAQRQAFPMLRVTDEGYAQLMRTLEYERELDIVAVASDGTIAAYAMVWLDRDNRIGDFGPVGARPAFRRRGLTRAVLLEGLRRMKARGADTAIVSTVESNVAAIPLYESIGFRRAGREMDYAKH